MAKSSRVLVWRRVGGRRRWLGEGEGWRREFEGGVLDEEVGDMVMWGVLRGGWVERAEEEGRAWRVVVADMVGGYLRSKNVENGAAVEVSLIERGFVK